MTCDEVRDRLVALLDGELDGSDAEGIRAHTGECAGCRAALHETEELLTAAAAWQEDGGDVWPALEPRIMIRELMRMVSDLQAEVAGLRADLAQRRKPVVPLMPATRPTPSSWRIM